MSSRLIKIVGVWCLINVSFMLLLMLQAENLALRAVMGMTMGLVIFWVILGGLLQRRFRAPIRERILALVGDWRLKFVLFAVLMALLEEAVTVTMTNLAPLFGIEYGKAYITASGNFFDVVLFHSVVAFVPMFMAWAWLLSRYSFSANAVFLLYGLTGTLAEALTFNPEFVINLGFWTFVYGLMVYLPAYSIPTERGAKPPRWWHYPLAIVFPLASAVVYILIVWGLGSIVGVQMHPQIHFPPLSP